MKEKPSISNTDLRFDELGSVNFTGFVSKKMGVHETFH
jgi:hypothetical protein